MTLSYYDKFAFLPKRCNKCNRLFWLEWYSSFVKPFPNEADFYNHLLCKKCYNRKKGAESTDV